MKRLLVVGAGPLQVPLIDKARELGIHTVAIDRNPNAVGFLSADVHSRVDISNVANVVSFARLNRIDGVVTAATDYGVQSASCAAFELGLPGPHPRVAELVKNKGAVRDALHNAFGDARRGHVTARHKSDVEAIREHAEYPLMVKPADGSGSQGVSRVESDEELSHACSNAIQVSRSGEAIVEPFLEGIEYGVESYVFAGRPMVLSVMNKTMTGSPLYAELGHSICHDTSIIDPVSTKVAQSIVHLGIESGAVNMDVMVTANGVEVIDVGARMGGNLIGSHLVPLSTGVDHVANIIRGALGGAPEYPTVTRSTPVATRILTLSPGRIESLPDIRSIERELDVEIMHQLAPGVEVQPYRTNLDGMGYVVATGDDTVDCEDRVSAAHSLIDDGIVRFTATRNAYCQ